MCEFIGFVESNLFMVLRIYSLAAHSLALKELKNYDDEIRSREFFGDSFGRKDRIPMTNPTLKEMVKKLEETILVFKYQ